MHAALRTEPEISELGTSAKDTNRLARTIGTRIVIHRAAQSARHGENLAAIEDLQNPGLAYTPCDSGDIRVVGRSFEMAFAPWHVSANDCSAGRPVDGTDRCSRSQEQAVAGLKQRLISIACSTNGPLFSRPTMLIKGLPAS